jgi:hypothetical protein
MNSQKSLPDILAVKDGSMQQSIPTAWRLPFKNVVSAFARGDYRLKSGVIGVSEISAEIAAHIQDSVQSYGATLIELPEETWESSVCMWYGTYWDALVDLWTQEEGRSDLVLNVRVTESSFGFLFKVHMVYVP